MVKSLDMVLRKKIIPINPFFHLFDELDSITQKNLLTQVRLDATERAIIYYDNKQEEILISCKGFYFLNRKKPSILWFRDIVEWTPHISKWKDEFSAITKQNYLKFYKVTTKQGLNYDLEFATPNCGYFLQKTARIVESRLAQGYT